MDKYNKWGRKWTTTIAAETIMATAHNVSVMRYLCNQQSGFLLCQHCICWGTRTESDGQKLTTPYTNSPGEDLVNRTRVKMWDTSILIPFAAGTVECLYAKLCSQAEWRCGQRPSATSLRPSYRTTANQFFWFRVVPPVNRQLTGRVNGKPNLVLKIRLTEDGAGINSRLATTMAQRDHRPFHGQCRRGLLTVHFYWLRIY